MTEPMPPHLDKDGQELWKMCEWIVNGGALSAGADVKFHALFVRRQLRLESAYAGLLAEVKKAMNGSSLAQEWERVLAVIAKHEGERR